MEPDRESEEQGHDEQDGPGRERDVGREEDDRDHDHREPLERELADAVLDELLEVLNVTGHAAHQDAGLLVGEEVQAEALVVGEDPDAQVVHHPSRERAGHVDRGALQDDAEQREDQVEAAADGDHGERAVPDDHPVVDRVLGQLGPGLEDEAGGRDDDRPGDELAGVGPDQTAEGEPSTLLGRGALAEGEAGRLTGRLGGQDLGGLVHELARDPAEGQAVRRGRRVTAGPGPAAAPAAAPRHQSVPFVVWARTAEYRGEVASRCAWVPVAATRPSSSRMMRWARAMVETRWAMTMVVRSRSSSRRAA